MKVSGKSLAADYHRQYRDFKKLMRAQGQEKESTDVFDELVRKETKYRVQNLKMNRHMAVRYAKMQALSTCLQMFPPNEVLRAANLGREQMERKQSKFQEELGKMEALKRAAELEDSEATEQNRYVMEKLSGKGQTTLLEDIEYARERTHMIGNPENMKTWLTDPGDAPSASAWNMLMYAVQDPREFQKMAVREMRSADRERELLKKIEELEHKYGVNDPREAGEDKCHITDNIHDLLSQMSQDANDA